jgi:hypothetical protein
MARPAIIAASVGDLDTLSVSFTRHLRAANLALRDHTYSEPTEGLTRTPPVIVTRFASARFR